MCTSVCFSVGVKLEDVKFNYIFDEIGLQQLALIPELWNVYMFDLSEAVVGDHEDGHADDD